MIFFLLIVSNDVLFDKRLICYLSGYIKKHIRVWDTKKSTAVTLCRPRENTYRGFSCDVISSQFCKSSYSRLPCWFPLYMEQYWKIQQNVPLLLTYSYHNTRLQLSDKNISTYTRWKFEFFLWSKLKVQAYFVVFSIPRHAKGNQAAGQNLARMGAYHFAQSLYCVCLTEFCERVFSAATRACSLQTFKIRRISHFVYAFAKLLSEILTIFPK